MLSRSRRILMSLACTLLLANSTRAQEIGAGATAPDWSVDKLLQVPEGTKIDWAALEGKAVVLEFWATWCGPCIQQIPHMNQLVQKFEGKPVVFLSVTDETQDIVEPFLKDRPMSSWIGLDPDQSMTSAYQVYSIPHLVLIGTDKKIRSVLHPGLLNEKNIEDLIAGK